MVRLRAGIAQSQQRASTQLALDGEKIVLVVRIRIAGRRGCHSSLRKKRRKIDIRVGMHHRSIEGWKRQREWLWVDGAVGGADERPVEERRLTCKTQSVGRLG